MAAVAIFYMAASGPAQEAGRPSVPVEGEAGQPGLAPQDVATDPLDYIMIHAPAGQEEEWRPTGSPVYLPMEPAAFEQLVRQAKALSSRLPGGKGTTISSARYEARLEGNALVDGRGLLQVEHLSPLVQNISLSPCNLAIERAGWADRDGETARLGLGPSGDLELRVGQPGMLDVDWSLQGRLDALGTVALMIELPPCSASQVVLTLPAGKVPVTQSGVVSRKSLTADGMRRWEIELGHENRLKALIAPEEDPEGHTHLTEVRENSVYHLLPGGLRLTTDLRFDILGQPLRRVELALSPELELISVADGDESLSWEVTSPREGKKHVVIQPSTPLEGLGRELTVTALAPLQLDRVWQLPRLTTQGVFWSEAGATLSVQRPLRLKNLVPRGARVSGMRPRSSPEGTEAVDLQLYSAEAEIGVVLGQQQSVPKLDYGVAVEMTGGQISGLQKVRLASDDGEHFQIEGQLTGSWVIDSVESENIGDWWIEGKGDQRRLLVELAKPLSSDQPVQLSIKARRLQSPQGNHSAGDMVPVHFDSNQLGTALIAVSASESHQLDLRGDQGLRRREAKDLSPRDRQLFDSLPHGLVFLHDGSDEDLVISLARRPAQYSADIAVSVSVAAGLVTESYVFTIDPEAARLEDVLVQLMKRPGVAVRWTPTPDDEIRLLPSSAMNGAESNRGNQAQLDSWEIRLRPSRSEPFKLRATRTFPLEETTPIGLARLPDASQQRGRLEIAVASEEHPRIENRSLTPIVSARDENATSEIPRSAYYFDPQCSLNLKTAPLSLRLEPSARSPSRLWVWECRLQSRLEPNGTGRHLASYRVENLGATAMHLDLLESVDVESVVIDGRRASWEPVLTKGRSGLAVRLPSRRRFQTVSICYRTASRRWSALHKVQIPFPEPNVPVLRRDWVVWLPPGREAVASRPLSPSDAASDRWAARVWGPLARSADAGPLDPLNPESWQRSSGRRSASASDPLGTADSLPVEEASIDWGMLVVRPDFVSMLGEITQDEGKSVLLIDVDAVEQCGVVPRTSVVLQGRDDLAGQVTDLLDRTDLALVVRGRGVVLTSAEKAVGSSERLGRTGTGVLWRVSSSDWEEEIAEAVQGANSLSLISAADWVKLPRRAALPWNDAFAHDFQPRDTVGWSVSHLELAEGGVVAILLVDRHVLLCGFWLAFLVAAFLCWTFSLRTPVLGWFPVAGFFLAAAYGPEFWSSWLSAGFWGSVVGMGVRLVTVRRRRLAGRIAATPESSSSQVVVGVVVGVFLVLFSVCEASAQSSGVADEEKPSVLIYVPIGEDEQPTGGFYYVPEPFYTELERRTKQNDQKSRGWLLKEADYRGRLAWQTANEGLGLADFKAEFELEIFGSLETIRIPLGDTEANWNLVSTRLDGGAIQPDWQDDGTLVFDAKQSDSCLLELVLRPIPGYGADSTGFGLTIPPLATSRLELTIPPDAPDIEVSSATGRTSISPETSVLSSDLGPVDWLEVGWRELGRPGSSKATRVEELVWLEVSLGYAMIDARFRYEIGQDFHGELHLEHDARLRQQGVFEVEGATLDHTKTTPEPPLVRKTLSLTNREGSSVVVRGKFLIPDASGVGRLRLPALRSSGTTVSRRLAAATVAPGLHYEPVNLDGVESLGVSEFVGAWGYDAKTPTLAFRSDDDEVLFAMTTYPYPSRNSVQWNLAAGYGLDQTRLRYHARVRTTEGYLFQHRLAVPEALEVEDLSVSVNDTARSVSWSRPTDDQIVLFFDAAIRDEHVISLSGRIAAGGARSESFGLVRLEGVEDEAGTVEVFRQPEVLVDVQSVEGMTKLGAPAVSAREDELGRPLTKWAADGLDPVAATVVVTPNRPQVVAEQSIVLRQELDGWTISVDCQLNVSEGLVDTIRLKVPPSWPGPYEVDHAWTVSAQRGEVILRPLTPIQGEMDFRLSGPLVPETRGKVSVPRIELDDFEIVRRLVVLPGGPDAAIRWETRGLAATDVPMRYSVETPNVAWLAYEVEQDDFTATVRPVADAPQVYLANVRVAWDTDGTCRAVAVFDLEAGEKRSCRLRLPDNCRLVAVFENGVAVAARTEEDGAWSIPFWRTTLPQRLEVVYEGRVSRSASGQPTVLRAPVLEGLPVARTLWTLASDDAYQVGEPAEEILGQRAALVRLLNVTALIDSAVEKSGSSPEEDTAWYRGWLDTWFAARHSAERAVVLASCAVPVRAEMAELETLDRHQETLAGNRGAAEPWMRLMAEPVVAVSPGAVWDRVQGQGMPRHYLVDGNHLELTWQGDAADPSRNAQPAVSVAVISISVLAVLLISWGNGWLYRWPHLVGVSVGLLWWLLLWPSVIGLLLVATSLIAAFRSGWRRSRGGGSAIVRLSVTGRS